jgi:uncharacterized membrane protein
MTFRVASRLELREFRGILLFACAQMLDLATTVAGLRSGRLREGNPLASGMLAHSAKLSFSLKLVIGFVVLLVLHRFVSEKRRAPVLVVITMLALAAPVANVVQLLRVA